MFKNVDFLTKSEIFLAAVSTPVKKERSSAISEAKKEAVELAEAKAADRENSDWEGVILMTCRPTKRRDELRRVVPLKYVQRSEAWALVPPREYCQR